MGTGIKESRNQGIKFPWPNVDDVRSGWECGSTDFFTR